MVTGSLTWQQGRGLRRTHTHTHTHIIYRPCGVTVDTYSLLQRSLNDSLRVSVSHPEHMSLLCASLLFCYVLSCIFISNPPGRPPVVHCTHPGHYSPIFLMIYDIFTQFHPFRYHNLFLALYSSVNERRREKWRAGPPQP